MSVTVVVSGLTEQTIEVTAPDPINVVIGGNGGGGGTGTSDHSLLTKLDFANSGHIGFQQSGDYIPSSGLFWKAPIDTYSNLPTDANVAGDVRLTLDTNKIYAWNGSTQWIEIKKSYWGDALPDTQSLPGTGDAIGDIHYVGGAVNALYVWNGSGWQTLAAPVTYWKAPTPDSGSLPLDDNNLGDVRQILNNKKLYTWDGDSWEEIAASVSLTFSSGLTKVADNVTNDLLTGLLGGQTIYGDTLISGTLNIRSNTNDTTTGQVNFLDTKAATTADNASVVFSGGLGIAKCSAIGTTANGACLTITATEEATVFDNATNFVASDWTLTSGWEATNDGGTQLDKNAAGATTATYKNNAPIAGDKYKITFTITATTATSLNSVTYGAEGLGSFNPSIGVPTTYVSYVTASTSSNLIFTPTTTSRFIISSILIQHMTTGTGDLNMAGGDIVIGGGIKNPSGQGFRISPVGTMRLSGSLVCGGSLSGVTTIGTTAAVTVTINTIMAPTNGLVLSSGTAASGTPQRISPSIVLSASGWNTTPTAAAKVNIIDLYLLPTTGATTMGWVVLQNKTVDGVADTTELVRFGTNGLTGFGIDNPLGKVHIKQASNTGAITPLTLEQLDISEGFIDYVGTSAASAAGPISTWTSGNSIQGFVRVEINGSAYWMPYYNAPSS